MSITIPLIIYEAFEEQDLMRDKNETLIISPTTPVAIVTSLATREMTTLILSELTGTKNCNLNIHQLLYFDFKGTHDNYFCFLSDNF